MKKLYKHHFIVLLFNEEKIKFVKMNSIGIVDYIYCLNNVGIS